MNKEKFNILFDKIYVVSLPKDLDRRNNITQALQNYGLSPDFIDGIYMDSIIDSAFLHPNFFKKEKEKEKEKEKFSNYRKRICGTYLAHLKALEKVLDFNEADSRLGIILEDDIVLKPNFINRILELVNSLDEETNWMCCSLQKRLYKEIDDSQSSNSLYYKGTTWGHQGYIYNRINNKDLLENFYSVLKFGCNEEIDAFYVRLAKYFPIYGTSIPIVCQSMNFESNISKDENYINRA